LTYNDGVLTIEDEFFGPLYVHYGTVDCEYSEILNESFENDFEVSFPSWATLIVEHAETSTTVRVQDPELFLDLNAVKAAIQESLR